ncbi:MAG: hypothetical protein JXQ23_00115 [Clostridia bacterium]|nr:hypothetical protein [Clostridia bacterium]
MTRKIYEKISLLVVILLFMTVMSSSFSVEAETSSSSVVDQLYNHQAFSETESAYALSNIKVIDCPEGIKEMTPSRVILQIINQTFYKWNEYDVGNNGVFCIVVEQPYQKELSKDEAKELLYASQEWTAKTSMVSEAVQVLSPDDPTINLPAVSNQNISKEKYLLKQKTKLLQEYRKNEKNVKQKLAGNKLSDEEVDILVSRHQAIVLEMELQENPIDVTAQAYTIDPIEIEPISITESESNFPEVNADLVNNDYYGNPPYLIFGTITDIASDLDLFRFDVKTTGTLDFYGTWVGDLIDNNLEEDLFLRLEDSGGNLIASSVLYGDGTASEQQQMTKQITAGTYYLLVMASTSHGDAYVGKSYGVTSSFTPSDSTMYDPVRLIDTSSYPVNTSGYIRIIYPNEGAYRASGFLVTPYTILTNGHVVYHADYGGYVTSLEFSPGQYQLTASGEIIRPYGTKAAVSWETNAQYLATEDFPYDYAAAHFLEPFTGIDTFMPLVFNYLPEYINIVGYPASAMGTSSNGSWHSYGEVVDATTSMLLCYKAYSSGGSSGSPVWEYDSDTGLRRVIAIHGFGSTDFNGGVRLISSNQALIEEWMQWSPIIISDVSGYISLEGKSTGQFDTISVTLTDGVNTYNGNTSGDGSFVFEDVKNSEYILTISRNGYLNREITGIIVNDGDVILSSSLDPIPLLAGDVDGLTGIDAGDLAYLISKLSLTVGDEGYDAVIDYDEATGIDSGDMALIIQNLGLTSADYETWTW